MKKLALEQIPQTSEHSFRLLLTPNLNDQYYWHFHPEYEICYVEGASGTRHIGDHISRYEGSDLVFIGPYIPHLNFDYGVRTQCEQVVIQMREDFLGKDFLELPEMQAMDALFKKAGGAVAFYGATKTKAGEMMKSLPSLDPFARLMKLLEVFGMLSRSEEYELLGAKPLQNISDMREQQRIQKIHRMVEESFPARIETEDAAKAINLSMSAFCRYFKNATGLTFTDYVNKYRINQARKLLLMNKNVTEACFETGFENLSHFNRTFRRFAGQNPSEFRKTLKM
ncbi:MAG TPA: AraC family transcriptional regulator [Chitinophagaceae bacterium]|nr:AraC family transcriptional regulator [Chitinophagaceae bacterium]